MSTDDTSPQPPTVETDDLKTEQEDPKTKKDDLETKAAYGTLWAARAQMVGTAIAALAFLVAIYVAYQGQLTIRTNNQNAERQSEDSQQTAAVTAIQSGSTQGAALGMVLLGENTVNRVMRQSQTGESSAEVYNDYNGALQIIAGYLASANKSIETCPLNAPCFGLGWGPPTPAIDTTDAANQIELLLNNKMESQVTALKAGQPSGIYLSGAELAAQKWPNVNLGWIPDSLVGTDLRGANLGFSQWSQNSDLSNSYLQCSDLQGAVFQGANLTGADLRGANVQGADFRGAHIEGALVTSLYGIPKWPGSLGNITTLPVKDWNQSACLANSKFWDHPSVGTGTGSGGQSSSTGNGG